MQFRRLRWHSRRRHEAFVSHVDQELKRWLDAWSVEPASFGVYAISADAYKPTAPLKWLRVNTDKGVLCIGAPAQHFESLGGLLANARADDILHLGRRIGDRALKALISQWMGVAVVDLDIQDGTAPADDIFHARFGHAVFSLKGPGFLAYVVFDAELVDSIVPWQTHVQEPLVSRKASLGNETIELNVLLDLGESKLSDTLGLQVGDVLVSKMSIHSHFHLAHPDKRRLANVSLVRNTSHKAVVIGAP